jgi:hypothetical protein
MTYELDFVGSNMVNIKNKSSRYSGCFYFSKIKNHKSKIITHNS